MSNNFSSDPVSDFLAREQDVLAELNDDEGFVPAVQQQPPPAQQPQVAPIDQNGLAAMMGGMELLQNGGDSGVDLNALDSTGQLDGSGTLSNGRGISPSLGMGRMTTTQQRQPEEEPEKIRKWREAQQKAIAEKDQAEEQKKEELKKQAKRELDEWHAQRRARLEQKKKENREREAHYHEEAMGVNSSTPKSNSSSTPPKPQPSIVATPQDWERISKMLESGARSVRSTKDTSRMKSLIYAYKGGSPTPSTGDTPQ